MERPERPTAGSSLERFAARPVLLITAALFVLEMPSPGDMAFTETSCTFWMQLGICRAGTSTRPFSADAPMTRLRCGEGQEVEAVIFCHRTSARLTARLI
jgi:hypothetical protein